MANVRNLRLEIERLTIEEQVERMRELIAKKDINGAQILGNMVKFQIKVITNLENQTRRIGTGEIHDDNFDNRKNWETALLELDELIKSKTQTLQKPAEQETIMGTDQDNNIEDAAAFLEVVKIFEEFDATLVKVRKMFHEILLILKIKEQCKLGNV